MGTDKDIDFTFFQPEQYLFLFYSRTCTTQVIYLYREIGEPLAESVVVLRG
ncbi:hypothetical protein SDC9_149841 [bioreactor metagenome]|uniref:Uncharacterized protein n=1 Tax=bioreactor metagenome TaxID=1076179 RepID=A0A645EKQ8_9ZZZZ